MKWEQPHWSGRPQGQADQRRRLRPNGFAKVARFAAVNRFAVVAIFLVAAVACGAFAAATLSIDPEADARVTLDDATARAQATLAENFPGIEQTFLAIVESRDSGMAKAQAMALATSLAQRGDLFASAFVPGTGPFYSTNAMLFRDTAEIRVRVDAVLQMQPLYQALAAAPDMLGLAALVSEIARAVEQGRSPPGLDALLLAAANAIEGEVKGTPAPVRWTSLAGLAAETSSTLWFVVAQPKPGLERAAATAARESSDGMQEVRWLWPRRALGNTGNPLRDFLVPAVLSAFVTMTLLGAGLGSFRLTLAVVLPGAFTITVAAAAAAVLHQPLDGATWSFAGAALAPSVGSSVMLVLSYMQNRSRGLGMTQSLMLGAQRRGGLATVFMFVFCAFWGAWLVRQVPSLSQFSLIAICGAVAAWVASLALLPAVIALLDRRIHSDEPHWLDEALATPASFHARNALDVLAMLVIAAAVFSAAFLPAVRFGERHVPSDPGTMLETPDARGAIHVLAQPQEVDAVVQELARLPEVGAIRTITQFMPPDTAEKIAQLRRLEGAAPLHLSPRPPADEETLQDSFTELGQQLTAISGNPSTSQDLRNAAGKLLLALELYGNASPLTASRVSGLESALFSGLGELSRSTERLAAPREPRIEDLDPDLLRRFVSPNGLWRIEVMPKPETGLLTFAAAIRRTSPQAAGEPIAALARNEIIHHETLLALAAALVGVSILSLAALRNLTGWVLSLVPVTAFVTLTAATVVSFDVVLNSAMLASASAAAAVLICSSVLIAAHLTASSPDDRQLHSTAMRAGLLPPIVLAGAVAPLTISSRATVAELGAVLAAMLVTGAVLCLLLMPSIGRWLKRLTRA